MVKASQHVVSGGFLWLCWGLCYFLGFFFLFWGRPPTTILHTPYDAMMPIATNLSYYVMYSLRSTVA